MVDVFFLKKKYKYLKFCMVGDGGVGKTAFFNYLKTGEFIDKQGHLERTPYINIDVFALKRYKIQLYDLAGQRRQGAHPLDHLQKQVLGEVDLVFLFFALDNLQSFLNIEKWYGEISQIFRSWEQSLPTMFLIGNKLDLPRKVESINGESLVKNIESIKVYFEISLFSGEDVVNLISEVNKELERIYEAERPENIRSE